MGIISVLLTFLLSAILYYQGMQDQFSHEVGHLTETMAQALSKSDEARSEEYLDRMFKENHEKMHIVWMNTDGTVLYDSKPDPGGDYLTNTVVQEALDKGSAYEVHKEGNDTPKNYYATMAPDDTILRISVERAIPYRGFSSYLPEIIVFLLVFMVGCLAAAEKETEKILRPFHLLGDLVQQIMEGRPAHKLPDDYKELQPLIAKVEEQHNDIENYLEDIEEERNTIRTVVDTIAEGIILLNEDKEIVDYNKTVEELFGLKEDKRYRRIASLYHDEDWLRAIGRAYHAEGRQEYTMTLFGRPYRMVMNHIELNDDEEKGLLIVLRDLTAAYTAEKMRREFSANVSHELKTPLTSISGFAEMIANGMYQKPEDVRLFGSRIMNESQRMLTLIDTIMHLSKVEETETTITWKTVSVDSLVRYATDLIKPQADAKGVTIDIDAQPLYTYGNPALLSELIMNLLDNSVKYNHQGGHISVRLAPEGEDKLTISVSDNGIGIPKEKQGRVFERFYRADESRTKATGGSGLGLAICKHIVEKHKGTLNISSVEGEGTTVTAILPRLSDADVNKENAEALTAKKEAADAESGRLAALEAEEDKAREEAAKKEESEKAEAQKKDEEAKFHHKGKKLKKNKKSKKKNSDHTKDAPSKEDDESKKKK